MGREVRRVPPNWQHPQIATFGLNGPQPMHDLRYEDAADKWLRDLHEFIANPPEEATKDGIKYFWDWDNGPPNKEYYRPWKDEEATWYQVWETVSEGTPVTPPFATQEELIQHLAVYGDDWDRERGHSGWGIDRARAFVDSGWVPSGMLANGQYLESKDVALFLEKDKEKEKP